MKKTITAWMFKDVETVMENQSVYDAATKMKNRKIGSIVVVRKKKPIGIFTERDLAFRVVGTGKDPRKTPIKNVMSSKLIVAGVSSSYKEVYEIMKKKNVRHLPIVERGALVGMVSIRDLIGFDLRTMKQRSEELGAESRRFQELLDKTLDGKTRQLLKENEKLRDLIVKDGLTDLYNYRYFETALTKEIYRTKGHKHAFSLLFVDIDHFKHYNDTNGHEKGNLVLKQISEILMSTSRKTDELFKVKSADIVARYGGEEFCIILPDTSKRNAVKRARNLLRKIRDFPFYNKEKQPGGTLSVSIGIAEYPIDAAIPEELIKKADEALYKAKSTGRARVVSW